MIIPAKLQARILNELHSTHMGIVKIKEIARSAVWWPQMDKELEDVVGSCPNCACQQSLPPSIPLYNWPGANRPMQRLHIDFASIDNLQIKVLVMINSYSKWIEAIPMQTATTNTTVEALMSFFCQLWPTRRNS